MKDRTVIYVIVALLLMTVSSLFLLRKAQSTVFLVRDVTDPAALSADIIPGKYFLVPTDNVLLVHEAVRISSEPPAEVPEETIAPPVKEDSGTQQESTQENEPTPEPLPEAAPEPIPEPTEAIEPDPDIIPDEIIPNTETSYVRIEGFIPGNSRDRIIWSDSLTNQSTTYVAFYQQEPFDLNQEELFMGAGMQRLTAQEVTRDQDPASAAEPGAAVQPDRLQLTASLPTHEQGRDRVYLIQGVDGLGRFDMNTEYLYKIVEPRSITIDGDFADWDTVPTLYRDPIEGLPPPGPDWNIIKIAVDPTSLYIYFTSAYRFQYEPTGSYSRVLIFFDIDADPDTGYRYEQAPFAGDDPKRFIGSEAVLNGASVYRQSAGSFNDGEIARVSIAPTQTTVTHASELSIPLSALRSISPDLSAVRILFLSDGNNDLAPGNRHSILISLPPSSAPAGQGTLNTEGGTP